jgi:hypothetical protein
LARLSRAIGANLRYSPATFLVTSMTLAFRVFAALGLNPARLGPQALLLRSSSGLKMV